VAQDFALFAKGLGIRFTIPHALRSTKQRVAGFCRSSSLRDGLRRKEKSRSALLRHDFAGFARSRSRQP
jgi:hypothetical protein